MKRVSRSNSVVWMIAAGLVASTLASAGVRAAEPKIAVVDYGTLLQSSPQGKAVVATLRQEFMPKQKQLRDEAKKLKTKQETLKRNEATMTQDQVDQAELDLREHYEDLARQQSAIQDTVNNRRNELMTKLQRTVVGVIQAYAKQHGYGLVLANGVIYSDGSLDITPAIMKVLQSRSTHSTAH